MDLLTLAVNSQPMATQPQEVHRQEVVQEVARQLQLHLPRARWVEVQQAADLARERLLGYLKGVYRGFPNSTAAERCRLEAAARNFQEGDH